MCTIEKHDLICPISQFIFFEPVTISSGWTFEKSEIKKHFKQKLICPITNMEVTDVTYPNQFMKNCVNKFLFDHSEEKINQFSLNHMDRIAKVNKIIKEEKFTKLLLFKNFNIKALFKLNLFSNKNFVTPQNFNIFCHIIDNATNIDYSNSNGIQIIHYLCKFNDFEKIKYIMNKGINLECMTKDDWRPIHYACRYGNLETIKYLVSKDVNIECKTKRDTKPIHLICQYGDHQTIKFFINLDIDIKSKINNEDNENNGFGPKELLVINENITPFETVDLIDLISDLIRKKSNH